MKTHSEFWPPFRLMLVSFGFAGVCFVGMVLSGLGPLRALLKELGQPGPSDGQAVRAIIQKFWSVELGVTAAFGAIALILLMVSALWHVVVFFQRPR